ncbi:hypothetical protein T265_04959 [Opisthorchis viverrini]|uniref:Uncharacterized protein n=1 Tax=Opisthorchis viverrini TaxID=6198 RepID=A0A074ZM41_OPIVI|nr:hypothetical protein T265_04959 [Opisthorchis viverrini]KER28121.1 hypothetical protein T265_04959 [Opisthorchis viverrini]
MDEVHKCLCKRNLVQLYTDVPMETDIKHLVNVILKCTSVLFIEHENSQTVPVITSKIYDYAIVCAVIVKSGARRPKWLELVRTRPPPPDSTLVGKGEKP